jgi:hypothetical protein
MSAVAPDTLLNVKHVSVTIDSSGNWTCTPDPVVVGQSNVLVYATLDNSPGYSFPDTGAIVIDNAPSDFPYQSWTVKPQLAAILDLHANLGDFKYTVNAIGPNGPVSYDPVIRNGNTGGGGGT